MLRAFLTILIALVCMTGFALSADFAADPAISPDGNLVCIVFEEDLWIVPFQGGVANRLTATEAAEWGPCWSPDGNWIAFNSNRDGVTYPYIISPQGGSAKDVIPEGYSISDWFADSNSLLCVRYNMEFGSSFYRVPLDGSRPILLAEIGDRYATLSPDNKSIVFNRNGNAHREAYKGSVSGELWKIDISSKAYTRLTETELTERYPRFSHTRNSLYYCASDGERFQVFRVDDMNFSKRVQLTSLPQWSARDISIARRNDRIVFERFDEIWKYDPSQEPENRVSKLDIEIAEDLWQQDIQRSEVSDGISDYAVSQDELLVAFKSGYDVFLIPRKGGDVRQLTHEQTALSDMEFLDKRTLLLLMMKDGKNKLYTAQCDSTMLLTDYDWFGKDSLDVESFTKDRSGRWVVYYGDKRLSSRVAVADKDLKNLRALQISRPVSSNFAINNSGDYAVYATTREDVWMRELWLYDFAKDTHTRLINDDSWIRSLAWTKDNKSILISRSGGIYRLDLQPRDEFEYDVDNWKEVFAAPAVPADTTAIVETGEMDIEITEVAASDSLIAEVIADEKPLPVPPELNIVWDGLDKRLFPILQEESAYLTVEYAIDDSTFYYISDSYAEDQMVKLKKANIYGKNSKTVTELGKNTSVHRWVDDNLYFLENGRLNYYNQDKGSVKEIPAKFDYALSKKLLNTRVFEEVWGVFGLNFYDPEMHGTNWEQIYQMYHPYAEKSRSIDNIATIVNEMIGDVNASHTGFYPRSEGYSQYRQIAALGVEFDQAMVLPLGVSLKTVYPTSRLSSFYKLKAGDMITHIDGVPILPRTPIDSLLTDKVGKRIVLRYRNSETSGEAIITGLSASDNRRLYNIYKIERSRKLVEQATQGRIGYVHIPSMGNKDYDNFYRDVFRDNADKEALIIDVRGNTGGHIHDQIISLLNREPYAYSTSRRYTGERVMEPRRSWMKPTIVLVDEGSFSDGEIFPTVYQELNLGLVVGMPSSGSVIGTWEYDLLDGSSMRLPGSGWYKLNGTNMEGTGVSPDIVVPITPEDEIAGKDTQLLRALDEIMKEVR